MSTPTVRAPRPSTVSVAVLALALAASCRPAGGPSIDLAAEPDLAAFHPETRVVDLGTPAARAVLQDGWREFDERWLGQRTFVWGETPASRIVFSAYRPGGRTLRFVCRPHPDVQDAPLQLSVVLNGELVDTVELRPGFREYRVGLPERLIHRGANRLEFHYRTPDGVPTRRLLVAWDLLRLGPAFEYGLPGVETVGGGSALDVPFYSELEYFVELKPGNTLNVGPIDSYGDQVQEQGARLEVLLRTENSPEPQSTTIDAGRFGSRHEVPLEVAAPTRASVSLRALPGYDPGRESGLRLAAPRLTVARLPAAAPPLPRATGPAPAPHPNVLVYLIDTLRADRLGLYGYPEDTSPQIDAFARDAITFDMAFTQSGWTRSSVASLFTGLLPTAHGVLGRDDGLSADAATMAQSFAGLGYQTVGITTNGNVSEAFGFATGFDSYVHLGEQKTPEIHVQSDVLNERFLGWLDDRPADRPFFAYLHASDPHDPYTPRRPFRDRFPSPRSTGITQGKQIADALRDDPTLTEEVVRADLSALYNGEIAQNDASFGALLDALRARGLYDSTVIVLLADHGEEFLDHGRWVHGKTLYREMIHMPLVIKLVDERNGGSRTEVLAQHIDVLPTLLDIVGGQAPPQVQGDSLRAYLEEPEREPVPRQIRSYLDLDGYSLASLVTPELHLIRPDARAPGIGLGAVDLYDLHDDPGEVHNLRPVYGLRAGGLLTLLRRLERAETPLLAPTRAEISDDLRDRLRALGYIQ